MEVVALVSRRDHASARYRIGQYAKPLEQLGLPVRVEALSTDWRGRLRQMATPRHNCVVFLQRKLLPLWQMVLLRQNCRVLLYDFDDAVYLRDSYHPRGPFSWSRLRRFQAAVGWADGVIAGNHYLAAAAGRYTNPAKIAVVPTTVDPQRYRPATHHDHQPTRLVWIGSRSSMQALEHARPVLEQVGQALPGTVLRVICDRFPAFRHLAVEPMPWSESTETESLGTADIGISLIPDDEWSRGKCGLKVLQYMAAGLPVVANPVGVHRSMLANGAGVLVHGVDQWVTTVNQLAHDHRLRQQMGREGRQQLECRFRADTWAAVLGQQIKEAIVRA